MKIGELARRTGVSTRLLRYYEEQGLIAPARTTNTYRTYDEQDVARVEQVVGLVRAGVPTRLARVLLDLEDTRAEELAASCTRQVAEMLAEEADRPRRADRLPDQVAAAPCATTSSAPSTRPRSWRCGVARSVSGARASRRAGSRRARRRRGRRRRCS